MFNKLFDIVMKHLGSVWTILLIVLSLIATILEVKYFTITNTEEIIIYFFFTLVIVGFILLLITKILKLSNQDPFDGGQS